MNKLLSQLPTDLDPQKLPEHVAIIMDGNGRWATQQGLPRIAGIITMLQRLGNQDINNLCVFNRKLATTNTRSRLFDAFI